MLQVSLVGHEPLIVPIPQSPNRRTQFLQGRPGIAIDLIRHVL